ncbi:MAG: 4Fe-4S dicluster domain-containing protein [Anaerolineae bacterium]
MANPDVIVLTDIKRDPAFGDRLTLAGQLLRTCIQCGTCTASCPSASAMDLTLRKMWRMVQLGLVEEVLRSKTMWLCSICYQCQVRCLRRIPLTETIAKLKQLAVSDQAISRKHPSSDTSFRSSRHWQSWRPDALPACAWRGPPLWEAP